VINPFNFTHKVGKGARLMWCLLAGAGAASVLSWIRRSRVRVALAIGLAAIVMPVAAATSILRPLTYLRDAPPHEAAAAGLLRRSGASLSTVVLLEDYRESQINQLAPVSTYFISSWSDGARSLSNAAGTWADQYVPSRFRPATAAREARNADVFRADDVGAAIRRLSGETRMDYVLTRRRYDLGRGFRLLVDWPGGYLYEILAEAK
jgi:hypothetical protein